MTKTASTFFAHKFAVFIGHSVPSDCWSVRAQLLSLACAFAAALGSGCGKNQGPERVVVSGTVTYNGKPIPEASIRFVPVQTSSVPVSGAWVTDGKYIADVHGGIPVGTHKIQIEANRAVMRGPPPKPGDPVPLHADGLQQYIPEKYNVKTQLEIAIQPGSREVTKNFELTD